MGSDCTHDLSHRGISIWFFQCYKIDSTTEWNVGVEDTQTKKKILKHKFCRRSQPISGNNTKL